MTAITKTTAPAIEDDRTGLEVETLKRALADNLYYIQGKFPEVATARDYYMALAYTVRDRLLQRWLATSQTYLKQNVRVVCYLSAEFLCGPHLGNNLINLGIYEPNFSREVLKSSTAARNSKVGTFATLRLRRQVTSVQKSKVKSLIK